MPLPYADPQRQRQHERAFRVQAHCRGDGVWEIDAPVRGAKTHPTGAAGRRRQPALNKVSQNPTPAQPAGPAADGPAAA